MKVLTQPVIKQSQHHQETRTAKQWLDALVSGECNLRVFLADTGDLVRGAPDAGWDLLALVDQYYRRGKISVELFGTVKAHLQGLLVGKGPSAGVSQPLPTMQDEPPPKASGTVAMPAPDLEPPISVPHVARSVPFSVPFSEPISVPYIARSVPVSVPVLTPVDLAPLTPLTPLTPMEPAAPVEPGPEDSPRSAAPRSLAVGDVLRGRYRVQGVLGRGGMGTVFAAADQYRVDRSGADQRIAIKVLHTEVIKRPRLFAELRREFQHLQSLSHPNIVRVHEFDRDGDLAFFTMEYLSGALLSRVMSNADSGALYRPYALAIVRDAGAAIVHAHGRGVVHGDLNPANIFITDEGEVRVLDFGASHQLHHGPWISEFDDQLPLAVATPTFASCQVLEGEVADARDDVYALACIAYTLLAGKHPFNDATALKARTARVVPKRPKGLAQRQWSALREGLRFDREKRPSDLRSWLDRLDLSSAAARLPTLQYLMEARPRRRGIMTWSAAAALLALAGAGAWFLVARDNALPRPAMALNAWITSVFPHRPPVRPSHTTTSSEDNAVSVSRPEPASEPSVTPAADTMAPPEHATPRPDTGVDPSPPVPVPVPVQPSLASSAATRPSMAAAQNGYASRARIELTVDNVEVPAGEAMARIVVHRSRTLRDAVSFKWWTESGTAKPGQDFVPVKTQIEQIDAGKNSVDLVVPIVMDPARRAARSFYVVIDEASDNAALGPRTLTMVTIPGAE